MYTRYKLTLAKRVTIPVGAVVELEVNEEVVVKKSIEVTDTTFSGF